jgi:hypothetical protein
MGASRPVGPIYAATRLKRLEGSLHGRACWRARPGHLVGGLGWIVSQVLKDASLKRRRLRVIARRELPTQSCHVRVQRDDRKVLRNEVAIGDASGQELRKVLGWRWRHEEPDDRRADQISRRCAR